MIVCRKIRQRIAAQNQRFVRIDEQPQDNKLTRLTDGKRLPVDRRQNERSYAIAFFMHLRDSHLSKTRPSWRVFLIGESRIPDRSFGVQVLLEHCLERTLPTLAQCGNLQRALQLLARVSRQIQEGVNLGHSDSLGTVSSFYNIVIRRDSPFLQYAKVESWSAMFYKKRRHARFIHADAYSVARHAWLRYLKYCVTNAILIADADLVVGQPLNGEVFSELAESKIVAAQELLPVVIRVHLINKNGTLFSAMTGEIGLAVAINIELAHHLPPLDGTLPDRGADSLAVPRHVARKTDVY